MTDLEHDRQTVERIAQRLDAQGLTYAARRAGPEPEAHLSYLEARALVRLAMVGLEHEASMAGASE